jgi:ParB-like chromosome segregation protein Spo0J
VFKNKRPKFKKEKRFRKIQKQITMKNTQLSLLDNNGEAQETKSFTSPVYNVKRIHIDKIRANAYNPNAVAPPEMKLLETSIWEDGYTMPVVAYYIEEEDIYEIVDGYHRYTTLKTSKRIYDREQGYLPVAVIEKDMSNRMASTIRHNRARGSHSVELMSNIVAELVEAGMSDAWILRHIGMDKDELLRLKQITGLASMFKDHEFSVCSELDVMINEEDNDNE